MEENNNEKISVSGADLLKDVVADEKAAKTAPKDTEKNCYMISNKKSGKRYYVRVRCVKKKNGVNYYGKWSKVKKVSV